MTASNGLTGTPADRLSVREDEYGRIENPDEWRARLSEDHRNASADTLRQFFGHTEPGCAMAIFGPDHEIAPRGHRSITKRIVDSVWMAELAFHQRARTGPRAELHDVECPGTCGLAGPASWMQIDHIKPWESGGIHRLHNLRLMCGRCNASEGKRPPRRAVQVKGDLVDDDESDSATFAGERTAIDDLIVGKVYPRAAITGAPTKAQKHELSQQAASWIVEYVQDDDIHRAGKIIDRTREDMDLHDYWSTFSSPLNLSNKQDRWCRFVYVLLGALVEQGDLVRYGKGVYGAPETVAATLAEARVSGEETSA